MSLKIQTLQRDQELAENLGHENENLKRKIKELTDIAMKISDYEYKIESVTKEIDRLNSIV